MDAMGRGRIAVNNPAALAAAFDCVLVPHVSEDGAGMEIALQSRARRPVPGKGHYQLSHRRREGGRQNADQLGCSRAWSSAGAPR
jgi:hypothetical protein